VSACTSACGRPAESISQQRHKLVATSAAWGDLKVREIVRFAKEICDVYALALKYRFDVFQQLHAILCARNCWGSCIFYPVPEDIPGTALAEGYASVRAFTSTREASDFIIFEANRPAEFFLHSLVSPPFWL
jgi:hypothetical protein